MEIFTDRQHWIACTLYRTGITGNLLFIHFAGKKSPITFDYFLLSSAFFFPYLTSILIVRVPTAPCIKYAIFRPVLRIRETFLSYPLPLFYRVGIVFLGSPFSCLQLLPSIPHIPMARSVAFLIIDTPYLLPSSAHARCGRPGVGSMD